VEIVAADATPDDARLMTRADAAVRRRRRGCISVLGRSLEAALTN
jgi:hypothetical protein